MVLLDYLDVRLLSVLSKHQTRLLQVMFSKLCPWNGTFLCLTHLLRNNNTSLFHLPVNIMVSGLEGRQEKTFLKIEFSWSPLWASSYLVSCCHLCVGGFLPVWLNSSGGEASSPPGSK